nr:cytochrome P450 [Dactylosporangium thailandense]
MRDYPFEPFRGRLPDEVLRMVVDEPVSQVRLPDGRPCWLVLGYEQVCTVLADPRFARFGNGPSGTVAACPHGRPSGSRTLRSDGPDHASLRRVAARAFGPRAVEGYRPRVQSLTDRLLDAMVARGRPADLMTALVKPLPVLVICELLGVPAADERRFDEWASAILSVTAFDSPAGRAAQAALDAYFTDLVNARRTEPGDDLVSAWLTTPLTTPEIADLAATVLRGGREINTIASGLRTLFEHPDQLALLRADPSRLPGAVEEMLRYSVHSTMFRVQTALEDISLAGVRISAGDCVMALPAAANRDPRQFAEPDVFDIGRSPNPHLSQGYGAHFCLGGALGRVEIEVAIGSLLHRFPGLAPAVPVTDIAWRNERFNAGMAAFPVTW